MKCKLLLLAVFLLPALTPSLAQNEPWNLEKCIRHAIENNIQIKQQQLNTQYSENSLLQSKTNLLPNVNANANQSFNWGRSVDPYTYEFSDENVTSNSFSL